MTNPFPPNASQVDMLTVILDAFPASNLKGVGAVQVPIQPKTRRPWAEQLVRRGVRVAPALMDELPLPATVQGGMSWFTPSQWVSRADYDKHIADTARPCAERVAEFREKLRAVDPVMVERIEAMTDEQRRAAMDAQMQQLTAAVEYVERVRGELTQQQDLPREDS